MNMKDKIQRVIDTAYLFERYEIVIWLSTEEKEEFDHYFEQFSIVKSLSISIKSNNSSNLGVVSSVMYKGVKIHVAVI